MAGAKGKRGAATAGRSSSSARGVVQWATIGMLAASCVALLVAINPYGGLAQPTDMPLVCLGVAGLIGAFLFPGAEAVGSLLRWRVAWALAALGAWAVVSSLMSGRLAGATFGTFGTALGWPVILLCATLVIAASFGGVGLRRYLVVVAAGVLLLEFAATILELMTRTVAAGTLSNSGNTGEVIVLLVPLVLWAGLEARTLWVRLAWFAVAATAVWTLAVGAARTSLVALVAALVVWGLLRIAQRFGRPRAAIAAVGASVVVVLAAFIASGPVSRSVADFWQSRVSLWEPAVRAFTARPVTGFGPDGYQVALARFGVGGAYARWGYWPPSVDPHDMVLWFAVSLGLVGVALAAWVAYEVGRSWWAEAHAGNGAVDAAVPVGPLATGVVLYAVSAMASPAALQTLPIALIVLGASLRPEPTRGPAPARAAVWSLSLRIAVIVLAVVVGAYGLTRLAMANRLAPQDPVAAQRAADLWRVDPYLYYNASLRWGFAAQNSPAVLQARSDLLAIRRAVELEPTNPFYQLELARTLVSYGAPAADIEAAYERAIDLAPASPEALAAYADYLIATKRLPEAKALLDRTRELARSTSAARVFAVYYRAIGDEAQAKRYDALQAEITEILRPPH